MDEYKLLLVSAILLIITILILLIGLIVNILEKNKKIKIYHISIDNKGGYYFTEIEETILEEIEILENVQDSRAIIKTIENMLVNDIYVFGDDITEIKIKCEMIKKTDFENLEEFNGW